MTNTTRRSFIKKSVVATVAITNLTIFSGLVDASGGHSGPTLPNDCAKIVKVDECVEQTREDGTTYQQCYVACPNSDDLTPYAYAICDNGTTPNRCIAWDNI